MYQNSIDPFLLTLYRCCTDPAQWTEALNQLAPQMGAKVASIYCVSVKWGRAVPYWMANTSDFDTDRYQREISDEHNPRLEARRFLPIKTETLVTDEMMFPFGESSEREETRRRFRKIGLGRFMGAVVPLQQTACYFTLALFRDPDDDTDFSDEQRHRLSALLPHFAQAVHLSKSLQESESASRLVNGHLDIWPSALIMCDPDGRVQWLNQKARGLLNQGKCLHLRDGLLRGDRSTVDVSGLVKTISSAADANETRFLALETPAGRLQLALQRLEAPQCDSRPSVLISITTENEVNGLIPGEALKVLFGLTDTEAQLTSALVAGVTVEQYAQKRGVTVGTARYQLNQVLVKVGAHRQADLVRRVLCSAAAHLGVTRGTDLPGAQPSSSSTGQRIDRFPGARAGTLMSNGVDTHLGLMPA